MGVRGSVHRAEADGGRPRRRRTHLLRAAAAGAAIALLAAGCTRSTGPAPASSTPSPGLSTPTATASPATSGPSPSASPSPSAPESPPSVPPTPEPSPAPPAPSATTTTSAAPPSTAVPAAWRGIDVTRVPTDRPVVALTFDAGSSDAAVASVLGTLARYQVPATFFVTGEFARRYPQDVRAMSAAGHPVGNHSDSHPDFTQTTTAEIQRQLTVAEASIEALTGRPARPLFRFPYGARTALDIQVVNDAGYVPFRWTVDTLGWKGTSGGQSVDSVMSRVLAAAQPGEIVLMHVGANPDDGSTLDAAALPAVIEALRARGYSFLTLRSLLP